ncbi:MAG: helix-turn-helix domain-containing protein [Acetobacteraceae bacterium]|nr:helix-turn-helix domain-containing protein [Acetobacteraceae bacterium]
MAIALVLEGLRRADAGAQCGMDRRTVRDCVHRFNGEGIAAVEPAARRRYGHTLSATQEAVAGLGTRWPRSRAGWRHLPAAD